MGAGNKIIMKTDKLFYSIFLSDPKLIHELIPNIPPDCQFSYSAPVIKDTEFRLDGLLTPLSDDPNLPLIFLGKSILNSAETEQEFQERFNLIEAILKSKLPQLSTEEILVMFDLKTAKMPELNAYETLVKYWQDKAKEEGLEKGRQEGLQEGRQEGLQEGLRQGESELLIRQLNRRCGILSVSLQEKVRSLSVLQLESLGENLLDFQGIHDLENWFNTNLNS